MNDIVKKFIADYSHKKVEINNSDKPFGTRDFLTTVGLLFYLIFLTALFYIVIPIAAIIILVKIILAFI
jgi:hypothetical protein